MDNMLIILCLSINHSFHTLTSSSSKNCPKVSSLHISAGKSVSILSAKSATSVKLHGCILRSGSFSIVALLPKTCRTERVSSLFVSDRDTGRAALCLLAFLGKLTQERGKPRCGSTRMLRSSQSNVVYSWTGAQPYF